MRKDFAELIDNILKPFVKIRSNDMIIKCYLILLLILGKLGTVFAAWLTSPRCEISNHFLTELIDYKNIFSIK